MLLFVSKLAKMVEDPKTDSMVSWSHSGDSFVVWDFHEFSNHILPVYFNHSNFASFNTQLNAYGFRKIVFDRWEYFNPWFQKGKKHLLNNIKRKPKMMKLGEVEVLNKKIDAIRSDVAKLREQQDYFMARIAAAEERLRRAESMDQHLLLFLPNNPDVGQKRKAGEGGEEGPLDLGKKCKSQSTGEGADCGTTNEHLSESSVAAKLYNIFVEFDDLLTKPSELEACIQSLFTGKDGCFK